MTEGPTADGPVRPSSGLGEELAAAGFEDARQVARGGAGVIYRCYETALGRNVAVKVLPSHFDDESRERFLREGYAMGSLSGHPNIVNILRVGVTPSGKPYIVMPYHAEDSLAVRLRREGPSPWPEALRVGVKLCGALETAHKTGTLHRDIKPANVLLNDYGEPLLSDFGIAHVEGGYETATGFFSGTIDYTAPEVMTGNPATVTSDIYSLGATIYALIAGSAAHERKGGEDLLAQYLRISTNPVPDMRPEGIPDAVCAAIEKAMAIDPAERPASAAEFGRQLQLAQSHSGLKPDSMAITGASTVSGRTVTTSGIAPAHSVAPHTDTAATRGPASAASSVLEPRQQPAGPGGTTSGIQPPIAPAAQPTGQNEFSEAASIVRSRPSPQPPVSPPTGATEWIGPHPDATSVAPATSPPGTPPPTPPGPAPSSVPGPQPRSTPVRHGGKKSGVVGWFTEPRKKTNRIALAGTAALVVVLLVIAGLYLVTRNKDNNNVASQPSTPPPAQWKPITNAPVARDAVATTQTDGTIWIFGGLRNDGKVTPLHEGYDPTTDAFKTGADLPVGVQHAMAVTWKDNPIVLGGWKIENAKKVATDKVWRVVSGQWVEQPHLLQPRAAAAAATVGDRIIVTGGVDASGAPLNTTEIFDGSTWTLGPAIPTPRQMLAAASDGKLMYTVGGTDGSTDLTTVEAYDPAAKTWTAVTPLPQPRSDLGVAITDGRLVAVGGVSGGHVLKSVSVMDLISKTWDGLPDMATPRHGMAVDAVEKSIYAIGGSTAPDDIQLVSTAEVLQLPPRKLQPAPQWRTLPDAPTARLMMAWAVLNGKIWIMGGLRDGVPLQTVESYDPKTGAWETGPPLPIPLHHAAAATYRGQVVVVGGESEKNIANGSNRVFALRGGNWVDLPSLTHARAAPSAAVVGDKLVVVGGQSAKQLVKPTEVFDGSSWKDAADLPTAREHLAAVSDGTYVYAVGGRQLSADKNTAALERFDPASGKWTKLVGMPTPRGSYGATYIDGRIVAVGGEAPTQVLNVVEMYDITDNKWTTLPPMPVSRHAEVVATVGNTVYVIGGANRPSHIGPIATVEALDFM
jgi:serine/threonine-protein kinase PknK